ncbi:hypothetical protein Lepto7375DRAFT_0982 [Leptolyngbya sp. PCC 7375]|nr:hypothetical protein Lepto7375DRAFT_0982 [Leptolyngbya sp. PCC 7375]
MVKIWQRRGFIPAVIVMGVVAISPRLFNQQIEAAIDAAAGGQNTVVTPKIRTGLRERKLESNRGKEYGQQAKKLQ